MKVMMLLQDFLPYPSGNGACVMTWGLLAELVDRGHEVTILRYEKKAVPRWPWLHKAHGLIAGMNVNVVDVEPVAAARGQRERGRFDTLVQLGRRVVRPRLEDQYPLRVPAASIAKAIEQSAPDVLYAFDMNAICLATTLGSPAPIVASIIDLPNEWLRWQRVYKLRDRRFGPLLNLLDTWAHRNIGAQTLGRLRACDAVIEHAFHHAAYLRKNGVSCSYLPNPVQDPGERSPASPPVEPRSKSRPLKVAMLGSNRGLATIAGLDFFNKQIVPALTDEDRTRMEFHVIGGDDPPRSILKRLKQESAVIIRGHVEDIGAEYVSADVVLVPTPIDLGFRTRIAEAMGYGAVVVAHRANAEGMPELVDDKNCVLRVAGPDLLEAIRALGANPSRAAAIRSSARDTFEKHYASTVVAGQMIAVMQGCFDERRSRLAERVDA